MLKSKTGVRIIVGLAMTSLLMVMGGFVSVAGAAAVGSGSDATVQSPMQSNDLSRYYDVIVIGSDPEGIAAALSSARNGCRALLIDDRLELGGLLTLGKLNTLDMNYDPEGKLLTRGIFAEFFRQVEGISFDINTAKKVFNRMTAQAPNLTLELGADIIEVVKEGNRVTGLRAVTSSGPVNYYAKVFIDATQDADIAYMAGVEFTNGQEDFGGPATGQVVTLVFEVGGVDWSKVQKALNKPGVPRSHSGATANTGWGFLEEMRGYQGLDPLIRTRGPNLGRMNNGNVLVNAMHIFGVNPLDKASRTEGLERGRREAENIVQYMKQHLPGFEQAYLVGTAQELYVRETRHMVGLYRLTINDVLEHRDFWDKIALGSYPVDIQPTGMHNWGHIVGNPAAYSIPLRSLLPQSIENMMVVGRSASYDSLAHGSARVVPIGMCTGEAAGVAAKVLLDSGLTVQELAQSKEMVALIQTMLRQQGAYLPEQFHYPFNLDGHWAREGVNYLRGYGLVHGQYNNDYRLDEIISKGLFRELTERLYLRQRNLGYLEQWKETWSDTEPLMFADAVAIIEEIFGRQVDLASLGLNYEPGGFLAKGQAYLLITRAAQQASHGFIH